MRSCGDWLAVEDEAESSSLKEDDMQQPLPRYPPARHWLYLVCMCLLILLLLQNMRPISILYVGYSYRVFQRRIDVLG